MPGTIRLVLSLGFAALMWGCTGGSGSSSSSSLAVEGDVAIAYVKRPDSVLGNPTDSVPDRTVQGGDLYIREKSSPSAPESNITGSYTQGRGDVSDPEVSYDGTKIIFSMRGPSDTAWGVWEYDTKKKLLTRISCDARDLNNAVIAGDDVDPAYLPDGRIVFSSNRQEGSWRQMQAQGLTPYKYTDEYEREPVTALHVMDADGRNCKQISFNQSHDRNPTVLRTGEIMYSRWDHVGGRNQFSIFKINPDGTNPFILYGAHGLDDIYLHPREMPDGRLVSSYMPLSGTREGGSIEIIDATNYTASDAPGSNSPPPNQLGEIVGQFQASRLMFPDRSQAEHTAMRGRGVSPLGRYSTPFPLWDGTNRMLVVFTPSQPTTGTNALGQATTVEGTPKYGIYMLDLGALTLRPVVLPEDGKFFSDPVALQGRPVPRTIGNFTPDTSLGAGMGLLDVNTVYDTDSLERMGDTVLAAGETIPRTGGRPDIASLKRPGTTAFDNRVARFFRITKAVPTPGGLNRQAIGETEFEMQQILGYGVIEPDGSIRTKVPADTPINITALDKDGRAFTPHTNWIQAREGERRFCKGCHSARLSTTNSTDGQVLNDLATVGLHPSGTSTSTMARTRTTLLDTTTLDLRRDPVSEDVWTPLYNTRDGTAYTAQGTISLTYAGLATTPTIKGPASCATTWSSRDCAIAINYVDHIQPIWDRVRTGGPVTGSYSCTGCHSGASPAGGLNLGNSGAGEFGRALSYQRLLLGEPQLDPVTNQPVIRVDGDEVVVVREPEAVSTGSARASRLVARLYEQPLKTPALLSQGRPTLSRPVCAPGPVNVFSGVANAPVVTSCQNHSGMLNASELRLVNEWADLGGQYFNDPYDGSGALRSNLTRLNQGQFERCIQPLFGSAAQAGSCASCHQAVNNGSFAPSANNRFILTGNAEGDFGVTASFVTDVTTPANSLLLSRPTTTPHPNFQTVMPTATYNTIRDWIANTLTCP